MALSSISILRGALWTAARRVVNLGTYIPQVTRAAALVSGDRVLDVGCGTGEMAPISGPNCTYLGIDLESANIEQAQSWHGRPNREFRVLDITRDPLPGGQFDVALMISVLHHMDAETIDAVVSHLVPAVRKRIVVLDLLALEGNPLQRMLVQLDQGKYPRSLWHQRKLLEKHVNIVDENVFATRSGSATHSLFVCEPRK